MNEQGKLVGLNESVSIGQCVHIYAESRAF